MNLNWFMRMSQWARNPPGGGRVKLVLGVVAVCIALVLVEKFIGWPDWLTTNGKVRPIRP
jgi:hypothetical protein